MKEEWHSYAGDPGSSRFRQSDLTRDDLARLGEWATWDLPLDESMLSRIPGTQFGPNEGTPLKVGNALYTVCAPSIVAKYDLDKKAPATIDGKAVVFDPQLYREPAPLMIGFVHRGLTYWQSDNKERIFLACGDATLKALDRDLKLIPEFGANGSIDVAPNPAPRRLTMTSPPAVCGDVVIVGSAMGDLNETTTPMRGDVRAYSAISGVPLWTFETIPCGDTIMGQPIDADWGDGSNQTSGHANVWAPMSVDPEAGLVYLPVSSAYNDAYGGGRPGDNRHSQSLVAVDVNTGQVRWEFQLVRHDICDYDPPAAPVLVDVTENGVTHKLVVQVTKQAFAYIFDRLTGEPRWPIADCPVPASTVPGEQTAATQPFPTRPLPFDHQGIYTEDGVDALGRPVHANVNNLSASLRQQIAGVLGRYHYGPLFTPPSAIDDSNRGTIQIPGYLGGASWAGAVADPQRQRLYVSSITRANVNAVKYNDDLNSYFTAGPMSWAVMQSDTQIFDYPLLNPPWGRVTAIDLATGEQQWQQPVGKGPRERLESDFKDINLPDGELGWPRRVHLLASTHVLFAAQEAQRDFIPDMQRYPGYYALTTDDAQLRAYDPDDGSLLHSIGLPMNAQGALMHFRHNGEEFIAVPVGGYNLPAKIVILGLA